MALLRAYDVLWSLEIQPHHPELVYDAIQQAWFNGFYTRGIQMDVVSPTSNLSGYRVVVAPALFLADAALGARLADFVKHGGTLMLTFRSGVKDPENVATERTLPGVFAEVCGVEVSEYDCLDVGETRQVELHTDGDSPVNCQARWWTDALRTTTASVLGTYASDYMAGQPAVTENAFGDGRALYVGTHLDDDGVAMLVDYMAGATGLRTLSRQVIPGVEISVRQSEERELVFVMNHADEPRSIPVEVGTDVFSGESLSGELTIPARDLRIVERRPSP